MKMSVKLDYRFKLSL